MELRKEVQFTDGSDFNAQGVKYQTEWILDKKNGAWSRNLIRRLKSVEVVDDQTVRWHFTEPWASFLDVISNVPGWPISIKALKADQAIRDVDRLKGRAKQLTGQPIPNGSRTESGINPSETSEEWINSPQTSFVSWAIF